VTASNRFSSYDIFYAVNNSTIYNYADDNTLSYADYDIKNVVQNLESDSLKMLDCSSAKFVYIFSNAL
jgi:hypothetical protein